MHIFVIFVIGDIASLIYSFNANYLNSDNSTAKKWNVAYGYLVSGAVVIYSRFIIWPDMSRYGDELRAKYGYVSKAIEAKWKEDGLNIYDKSLHTEYLEGKNGGIIARY